MRYIVTHVTAYQYGSEAPVCHNEVHLQPREMPYQRCEYHRLTIEPKPSETVVRHDYFGNPTAYFSIYAPHRSLTVTARSRLEARKRTTIAPEASPTWEEVVAGVTRDLSPEGLDAYQFVFESPYVVAVPGLREYAATSFPPGRPILLGALELMTRIHRDFAYDPKSTHVRIALEQVFRQRRGVCQDFAHLQIGGLRSLGIPARYVSGYLRTYPPPGKPRLVGADASHAWLAVYGGPALGWIDLDPTNNSRPGLDHLTLGWGRDYGDVCPIQGVFVGGGEHAMTVSVDVAPLEGDVPPAGPT